MKMKKAILLHFVAFSLVFSQKAYSDNLFGEFKRLPDQIERGLSIGADFGFFYLTGQKGSVSNPGFQLAFTTGYDLFDYLSVEGVYILGINEASPNDPNLSGGVNTFLFNLALKGQYPLGRFYPFFEVGPGIHYSRPEFVPGENKKFNILFAGGLEYYTYLRHYSLYIKTSYSYIKLPIDAVTVSAGLKYTF